jgi:mersacidin/lichenicidin family type 2 lantibiotic
MSRKIDIVRAWKDAEYRVGLSADELASLPQNPVGDFEFELSDEELALIAGAEGGTELGELVDPAPPKPQTNEPHLCTNHQFCGPTLLGLCYVTIFYPCTHPTDPRMCRPNPTAASTPCLIEGNADPVL